MSRYTVIFDIVAAYASGQIDLSYARESIRQVIPAPYVSDGPYVETFGLGRMGGVYELSLAARFHDLLPEEYELLRVSLFAKPVGSNVVDLRPKPASEDAPVPSPDESSEPSPESTPAPDSATESSKDSPESTPTSSNSMGPISIADLLSPDEDDREFLPASDVPDQDDNPQPPDTSTREKVKKFLAAFTKHDAPTHSGTGTDQGVHDPGGGGGAGEEAGGESGESTPPADLASADSTRGNRATRPNTFDGIIGQDAATARMKVMVDAAKNSGRQLDHVLLTGPPGLGKTTIGKTLASELDAKMVQITGPALRTVDDLQKVLSQLNEGDILFIDEIHAVPSRVQEILFPAMEDFELDSSFEGKPMRVGLPQFTLIGATTNPEGLLAPLRDRFGSVEQMQYYDPEDLSTIAKRTASKLDMELSDEAALAIAARSRGTPRAANRYVRRVRDVASSLGHSSITPDTVSQAFKLWEVDAKGLTRDDRAVLSTLADFKGPAGLNTVASMTGLPQNSIKDVIEPFLMREGLLQRTPSGRILTDAGRAHLQSTEFSKSSDPSTIRIVKSDSRRNLVFGWANVAMLDSSQVEDTQGHLIDVADLEDGAYNFVVKYRTTGDEHAGDAFGELVESIVVTEDKIAKGGFPESMLGHWWVGFRVPPEHWDRVSSGDRSMFSIQGKARLEPLSD